MTDAAPPPPIADPSWRGHVLATLRLGLPLVGSQLAFIGLGVTDTVMLGWLGVAPLAASVLGTQLIFLAMITGSGLANAVSPIVASAFGAGDVRAARRSVRMSIWGSLIYALIVMPILWQAEAVLLLFAQDPDLSVLAQDYVRLALWALPLMLVQNAIRSYLTALEAARIVFWATLAGLAVNAAVNYAFIFGNWGAPAMGIRGAALATLATTVLVTGIMAAYALRAAVSRPFEVFARFWQPDWDALSEVFRLGWPISLTLLAEVSLFAISSLMMGWVGTIALAAHGIAMQVISVMFMVPLGLAFAATVRVGRAVGRRDREGLIRASVVVGAVSLVLAVAFMVILLAIPEPLIWLFLDSDNPDAAAILSVGVPLLAVAALFQVVDTGQVMMAGMLRGLKDTRVPMLMAVVSYMLVGIPVAYGLAFFAGWGGVGVWLGMAAGLFLAAGLLGWRYLRLLPGAVSPPA